MNLNDVKQIRQTVVEMARRATELAIEEKRFKASRDGSVRRARRYRPIALIDPTGLSDSQLAAACVERNEAVKLQQDLPVKSFASRFRCNISQRYRDAFRQNDARQG